MEQMNILPAGDRAMVADFGNVISEEVNRKVNLLQQKLAEKELPGVLELVPAFRSLLIEYDPAVLPMQKLREILLHIPLEGQLQSSAAKHIWKVPCCYGGKYGEDLQSMAELTGLSPQEIIRIHSGTDYRVYMLGFCRGLSIWAVWIRALRCRGSRCRGWRFLRVRWRSAAVRLVFIPSHLRAAGA